MNRVRTSSCRPLKCQFCCRRFKYESCMKDHIKSDHLQMLKWLHYKMAHTIIFKTIAAAEAMTTDEQTTQPVRVPVITKQS